MTEEERRLALKHQEWAWHFHRVLQALLEGGGDPTAALLFQHKVAYHAEWARRYQGHE